MSDSAVEIKRRSWTEKTIETVRMGNDSSAYSELVCKAGFDADDTALQVIEPIGGETNA